VSSTKRHPLDLSPYPWPVFAEDEVSAVRQVLSSGRVNYWTGNEGKEFETLFAEKFGVKYAVAMANGTVTLQGCLRVLGIGYGDEVITTPRTFIATSSSVVLAGAKPIFADVDRDSGNITAETIAKLISPRTKAILPVHLAGWPCEMDPILDLAKAHGLFVIEDCAQSHGALYRGHHTGTFGHVSSWSFCQEKIMTTGGEGGMVGTNDEELWAKLWSLKDHGKSYAAVNGPHEGSGFRWVHESWGSNWRLTEMQSTIGKLQLEKLPEWTALRIRNASILEEALRPLSALRVPVVPSHMAHGYYKLYAYVQPEALRSDWSRDRLLQELREAGVPAIVGSCPEIYRERVFVDAGLSPAERLPVAQELGETSLMFQVHPTLPEHVMHQIGQTIQDCVAAATR